MRKRKKKLVVALVLSAMALLLLKQVLNVAVKVGLERGFAAGTDCIVTVQDATFNFFPLGASIKNAQIRHPTEPPDHGFKVREGSVRLVNIFQLLTQKKIRLTDLFLNGVSATSFGDQTGFINTIDFLASGDDNPNAIRTPQWHDFISRGWKVKLVNLFIHANEGAQSQLVIGSGPFIYKWNDITFGLTNTDPPDEPTVLSGTAQSVSIQFKDEPPILHGESHVVVDSHKGVLWAREASINLNTPSGPSTVTISGEMHIRDPNPYRLKAEMAIPPDHLKQMLAPYSEALANLGPSAKLEVDVGGALLDPVFEGDASVELTAPPSFISREACTIHNASSHFRISAAGLTLKNTQIESLFEDSLFELDFSDTLPFRSDARLAVSPDDPFVRNCISPTSDGNAPKWMQTTLENFISDSVTNIQASGTVKPLSTKASLQSDILVSQKGNRSKLSSELAYNDNKFNLTVREVGSALRIRQTPGRTSPDDNSTSFSLATKASLLLAASYDTRTQALDIPTLEMRNYPLAQLVARAAPFMSDQLFGIVFAAVHAESLVDGALELHRPASGNFSGKGGFTISSINPFGLPVTRAKIPVSFGQDSIQFSPIEIESSAGSAQVDFTTTRTGDSTISFAAPSLDLTKIPTFSNSLQVSSAIAQLQFALTQKSGTLNYTGDARISTIISDGAETLPTEITVSGSDAAASVKGAILGDRAQFDLIYPLGGSSSQPLSFDGAVSEFPLEIFLPVAQKGVSGKVASDATTGTLSGQFHYKGPRTRPLLGSGSAEISKLLINADGVTISHPRPLILRVDSGTLTFADVTLLAADKEAVLEGYVSDASGWHATVKGTWDLHSIAPKLPRVEQISGELTTNVAISGAFLSPSLSGPVTIREGAISFPLGKTVVGANHIAVESVLDKNTLTISRLFGAVGNGQIIGRGSITDILSARDRAVNLNLSLLSIELEPVENFSTRADGLITVAKEGLGPTRIAGDVNVTNAYYEDKINLKDILAALTRIITGVRSVEATGGSATGTAADLELDLSLHADNSIILETNIAQAELKSDLHVQGPTRQLRIGGTIDVVDGSFGVQSRKFDIVSGRLTFPDQRGNIDPAVDIIGETVLMGSSRDTYQVLIDISGTLTKPTVSFSSDSGLAERDIISLLFFGGQIEELSLLNLSTDTSRLSYGEILNPTSDLTLAERLTALASFSDVSIDTVSPLSTNELVPVVSATRPIIEGVDLILRSELSSNQRSSATVAYSLTPYLSMVASWGSRSVTNNQGATSTVGIGLRYRRSFPGLRIFPRQESVE